MEFGIEKSTMLIMKSGKRETSEGLELSNKESIKKLGKKRKITSTWEYWKWTPSNKTEMKENIRNGYLRRTIKLFETRLCSRNLIKGINTWAISLVRYPAPFLK